MLDNKLLKRYDYIDAMRLFFAFCVVLIHVPLFGSAYLAPIYRCAVPFFYTVTGFFLYRDSAKDMTNSLFRSSAKWFMMWIRYFIILTVFSVFVHSYFNQPIAIEISDIVEVLSGQGSSQKLDVLMLGSRPYGIYVLWFLLSGSYALALLGFLFTFTNKFVVGVISLLSFIACVFFSCIDVHTSRIFSLSLPFLTLGILLRKYIGYLSKYVNRTNFIIVLLLLYCEFFLKRINGISSECFLFTPVLISLLFAYMVKNEAANEIISHIADKGRSTTLDIYIYHRPIWLIISALTLNIGGVRYVGALITFIVVYALSDLSNKLKRKLKACF